MYPVETSSNLRGTTGSVTASELIRFHHSRHRRQTGGGEKEEEEEDDDDDDDDGEDDDDDGVGGLTVRISPAAMTEEAPSTSSSSFLYPLLQTLDHEPPLSDENDNPNDNPAQDKYRILAHDMIRGLVDPGLKPDRNQRMRLERIVSSPSYHLSTEEKDLLWRFRFSLVDERRALTKFLLAVDWTVESEVVQAAELLEQWKKRSPIEVTDALKLLGRNVAFQTGLVSGERERSHGYLLPPPPPSHFRPHHAFRQWRSVRWGRGRRRHNRPNEIDYYHRARILPVGVPNR